VIPASVRWSVVTDAAVKALTDYVEAPAALRPERARAFFGALADLKQEYARQLGLGLSPKFPPTVMAADARIDEQMAAGRRPDVVAEALGPGRPPRTLLELQDIGHAVLYCRACEAGGVVFRGDLIEIDDPEPIKRMAGWYDVAESTVRGWRNEALPELPPGSLNAEVLISRTFRAAERYRKWGRSASSVRRRDAKRSTRGAD
jgi:hypothetical protein